MANNRAPMRVFAVTRALATLAEVRRRPASPRRILVLQHLLLGDTIMITGVLAKLRERFPEAEIMMAVPRAFAPLYAGRPYGIIAHPWDPRDWATVTSLRRGSRFDLALLPADNRWSWLARALGARWIVGIAADRPAYKNWPVDELIPYSETPAAFCDTASTLIEGAAPTPFDCRAWPDPPCDEVPQIKGDYAVLHVGAGSPLKRWDSRRWGELAQWIENNGMQVIWSAGPGEEDVVNSIDPGHRHMRYAGTLSLAALWHLLKRAQLLVCLDTGVAHLGRVTGVPTVTLYGPGSAVLCGRGAFFANSPGCDVTIASFPCRDQRTQFFREVAWVRRCERPLGAAPMSCPNALCMMGIETGQVVAAIKSLPVLPRAYAV
jgi:ADP-heptose:LPS heptosyltransferase